MQESTFEVHARAQEREASKPAATAFVAHRHCAEFLLAGWTILEICHRDGGTGDLDALQWLLNSIG